MTETWQIGKERMFNVCALWTIFAVLQFPLLLVVLSSARMPLDFSLLLHRVHILHWSCCSLRVVVFVSHPARSLSSAPHVPTNWPHSLKNRIYVFQWRTRCQWTIVDAFGAFDAMQLHNVRREHERKQGEKKMNSMNEISKINWPISIGWNCTDNMPNALQSRASWYVSARVFVCVSSSVKSSPSLILSIQLAHNVLIETDRLVFGLCESTSARNNHKPSICTYYTHRWHMYFGYIFRRTHAAGSNMKNISFSFSFSSICADHLHPNLCVYIKQQCARFVMPTEVVRPIGRSSRSYISRSTKETNRTPSNRRKSRQWTCAIEMVSCIDVTNSIKSISRRLECPISSLFFRSLFLFFYSIFLKFLTHFLTNVNSFREGGRVSERANVIIRNSETLYCALQERERKNKHREPLEPILDFAKSHLKWKAMCIVVGTAVVAAPIIEKNGADKCSHNTHVYTYILYVQEWVVLLPLICLPLLLLSIYYR